MLLYKTYFFKRRECIMKENKDLYYNELKE